MPESPLANYDVTGEVTALTQLTPHCLDCMTRWVRAHIQAPRPFSNTPHPDECPICHEQYDSDEHAAFKITDVHTCSGHVFGLKCIIGWLVSDMEGANTCPMCRGELFILKGHEDENEDEDGEEETLEHSPRSLPRTVEVPPDDRPQGFFASASEFGLVTSQDQEQELGEQQDRSERLGMTFDYDSNVENEDDDIDVTSPEFWLRGSVDESWYEQDVNATPSSNSELDQDDQSDAGSDKSSIGPVTHAICRRLIAEVQLQYFKSRFSSSTVDVSTQIDPADCSSRPHTLQEGIRAKDIQADHQANTTSKLHSSRDSIYLIGALAAGGVISLAIASQLSAKN